MHSCVCCLGIHALLYLYCPLRIPYAVVTFMLELELHRVTRRPGKTVQWTMFPVDLAQHCIVESYKHEYG